jgi:hypothetical protein
VPDASAPTGQASSPPKSSVSATQETETKPTLRYVVPNDLDAAIRHLDDQQLDKLVSAALEERKRRKRPSALDKNQQGADADRSSLPLGKLNAVRVAFKAGVTPARIAREFGISRTDVQRALAGHAMK